MNTHDEFEYLMSAVLDHEAAPDARERLTQHLAHCPKCSALWVALNELDAGFALAPMFEPAPGLPGRVLDRLKKDQLRTQNHGWLGTGLVILVAATGLGLWASACALAWWGMIHLATVTEMMSWFASLASRMAILLRAGQLVASSLSGTTLLACLAVCSLLCLGTSGLWVYLMANNALWWRPVARIIGAPIVAGRGERA